MVWGGGGKVFVNGIDIFGCITAFQCTLNEKWQLIFKLSTRANGRDLVLLKLFAVRADPAWKLPQPPIGTNGMCDVVRVCLDVHLRRQKKGSGVGGGRVIHGLGWVGLVGFG